MFWKKNKYQKLEGTVRYGSTLIIIGASFAGISAALHAAKSGRFKKIIIIEKDFDLDSPNYRPGVGQGDHVHLMSGGFNREVSLVVDDFFEKVLAAGFRIAHWGLTSHMGRNGKNALFEGKYYGFSMVMASRPALEALLRRELKGKPEIYFVTGAAVTDYLMRDDQVVGVRCEKQPQYSVPGLDNIEVFDNIIDVYGDTVIIASGRTPWQKWNKRAGFSVPTQETFKSLVAYIGADFKGLDLGSRYDSKSKEWVKYNVRATAETPQRPFGNGVIDASEDFYKLVLIYHRTPDGYKTPKTKEDLIHWLMLSDRELANKLAQAEMISKVRVWLECHNVRYDFKSVINLPRNVFIIGDAFLQTNPRYGSGGYLAFMGGRIAIEALLKGLPVQAFFEWLAEESAVAWTIAVGADLAHQVAQGLVNVVATRSQKFKAKFRTLLQDSMYRFVVARNFFGVTQFVVPFRRLAMPDMFVYAGLEAIKQWFGQRFGRRDSGSEEQDV